MKKFARAAMLLTVTGTMSPVSAQMNSTVVSGAVQVTATETAQQGIRSNYNLNSRGTVALVEGQVVVITAGHAIDVSEKESRITRVSIRVNGRSYVATSWESKLGNSQDVGYIRFEESVQQALRPLAVPIATTSVGNGATGRLFYLNRGRADTTACSNITSRQNMVLQARGDGLHPTTQVNITAECSRTMSEDSLSGSSLLNTDGEIVGIFFADIEDQRGMNAAFSTI